MFDQPELEALLRANLPRYPSATLRGGTEVTALTQDGDGPVRVDVTDHVHGTSDTLLAAYVLGCDGANSIARTAIDAHMTDLKFDQRWLVVDVDTPCELAEWDGVHQVCDTRRAGTYMRIGDTRYRWEFRLAASETADDYRDITGLHPLIAPWTTSIPLDRLHIVRVAEYTFRAQIADRWRDRRIFLLGDAAHLTPPFIGQGMGAGLRDAANLAWKLAAVLSGDLPDAPPGHLRGGTQAARPRHDPVGEAGRNGHDRRRRVREAGAPAGRAAPASPARYQAARPGQPHAAAAAHRPGRPASPGSITGRPDVPERRHRRHLPLRRPRRRTLRPGHRDHADPGTAVRDRAPGGCPGDRRTRFRSAPVAAPWPRPRRPRAARRHRPAHRPRTSRRSSTV